jgi:hypothetical protein
MTDDKCRLSKNEIGYAQCQIQSDLALDRERLQRDRTAGSADEDIGAKTQADGNISACPDIAASQCAAADITVARKDTPEQRSLRALRQHRGQPA